MTSPNKIAPKNMRVLITGATGFVGLSLVPLLKKEGYLVRTANHVIDKKDVGMKSIQNNNVYFDLDVDENNYDQLLAGVDIVVHLAARVHILGDKGKNNDQVYKRTNTLGTENLAKESVKRGIKRFIYLSSIKVNGESNIIRKNNEYCPFKEDDIPRPNGAYAISKLEAEDVVRNICSKSAMDFVILRLPLIYGPGVKANFLSLINIINKNIPLP